MQSPRQLMDDFQESGEPSAVEAELKHMAEAYAPFPALVRLPDFLSVDAALALLPDASERDFARDEIHSQLEDGGNGALRGAFLDGDEQRLFALWVAGHLTQALAVYDRGRLAAKRIVSRGQPMLGELLEERDGSRLKILVERITTMSVCCLPRSLDVLRVSRRGILSEVLSFPKSHANVGPGVSWSFLNHFEFEGERVVISSVLSADLPSYELVYDKRVGRYQPTAATAKLLVEAQRERERLRADGTLPYDAF